MYAASINIKHTGRNALLMRPTRAMLRTDFAALYGDGREVHWRFADKSGWTEGSPDAWKFCQNVESDDFDFINVRFHARFRQ